MVRPLSVAVVALLAGLFGPDLCSAAPSFDCGKASGTAEQLICVSPKLSNLDAQMADEYSALRATSSSEQQSQLLQSQRLWVRSRSGCRNDACLEAAYNDRLMYFARFVQHSVQPDAQGPVGAASPSAQSPAEAKQKIAYASRAGMGVTVTSKSGIGTSDAKSALSTRVTTRRPSASSTISINRTHASTEL